MVIKNTIEDNSLLSRISNYMLINYSFIPDISLFYGKMGGVIFFCHYGRYTDNKLYDEFANELLDELYEEISTDIPVGFSRGLCGIGWGIEYLVSNKFMKGNTSKILADLDKQIMNTDIKRIEDLSMETGLGGILFYINARLRSSKKQIPFDSSFLKDVFEKLNANTLSEDNQLKILFDEYRNIIRGRIGVKDGVPFPTWIFKKLPNKIELLHDHPIGVANGLTGVGLKLILQ